MPNNIKSLPIQKRRKRFKITKPKRYVIYKKVYGKYRKEYQKHKKIGICWVLKEVIWEMGFRHKPIFGSNSVSKLFPELLNKKPTFQIINSYWWPLTKWGRSKRLQVLRQCIKESKPKERVKRK